MRVAPRWGGRFSWIVIGRRSPYLPSVVAATAPARLAEASRGEAWWRELLSGGIEVVTIDGGVFQRHIVDDDGTISLAQAAPPTLLQRRGRALALTGWLLGIAAIVGLGVASPDGRDPPAWAAVFFVLLVIGGCLFVGGGIAYARGHELESRLKRRGESVGGWHVAPALNGWMPRTTAQLEAAEDLADRHGGVAYVRDDAGKHVEVLVRRNLRIVRYWADVSGSSGVTSNTLAGFHSLSWHAKRLRAFGGHWVRIQTEPPPSD